MENATENHDMQHLIRANGEHKYSLLGAPRLKPIGAQKHIKVLTKDRRHLVTNLCNKLNCYIFFLVMEDGSECDEHEIPDSPGQRYVLFTAD